MSMPDFDGISTSAISDVLREGGLAHRALNAQLASATPGLRLCGPAYCVRGESALGAPAVDTTSSIRFEMYRRFLPGSVLLIGSGGYDEAAIFGEIMAHSLAAHGCGGAVVDGGIRNSASFAAMGFPVYARFRTPVSAAGRWRLVEIDEPLYMPGQTTAQIVVNPGDWLVGDCDGIVVVPAEHVEDVARDARRLMATLQAHRQGLAGGDDPEKVVRGMNRFGHVRRYARGFFA